MKMACSPVRVLATVALLALPALGSFTSVTEDSMKNRPVSKVITLLKDMMTQLEKEAEEDQKIYDSLACWCTTNDQGKATVIADAEARIESLEAKIAELSATSSKLNTEIADQKAEVAANEKALEDATKLREKQLAEFTAEEQDLLNSIDSLGKAIDVLGQHHSAVFLQVPQTHVLGVAATLQHELRLHASLLKGVLTRKERRAAASFIQAPQDFIQAPETRQSYDPASGAIFGILKQMKETFETNLADSQKEELTNQKAYEDLKAAKEEEIAAGQKMIKTKTAELAAVDQENAEAEEDKSDTQATMEADMEFLAMLKEKCSATDSEFEERTKTRQLEMEAVSKALAVLSTDDATDLFTSTYTFVQAKASQNSHRREQASKLLAQVADEHRNPHLAALALRVKLDAFTKVKKTISDMIAQLTKEKEDEIKHKDFCIDELDKNERETQNQDQIKSDKIDTIADLEMKIKALSDAIDNLKAQVNDLQVQLKHATETRDKTSKEFQQMLSDAKASEALLQKALSILEGFYKSAALVQTRQGEEPAGPPPPPGFEKYKKNEASSGVMNMITQIIEDTKAMKAEAIKSEQDSLTAYGAFVKETTASIDAKSKDIVDKTTDKAKKEMDLVQTKVELSDAEAALEELASYNAELHKSCDFVLKNFEKRQTARDEEIEALKQAAAILSGAKFEEFLQRA